MILGDVLALQNSQTQSEYVNYGNYIINGHIIGNQSYHGFNTQYGLFDKMCGLFKYGGQEKMMTKYYYKIIIEEYTNIQKQNLGLMIGFTIMYVCLNVGVLIYTYFWKTKKNDYIEI